jgi:hypothetical protein
MILLNLEGWPASGKTLLWSLLDGGETIFVDPIHSYFHYAFLDVKMEYRPTTNELRKQLAKTEFYKIEQHSLLKSYPISYGKGQNKDWPFIFPFHNFEKELFDFVHFEKPTYYDILDWIMHKYVIFYSENEGYKFKYFCTMSNYFFFKKYNNHFKFPQKTIVLLRNVEDIIASRISRTPREMDGLSSDAFSPSLRKLLNESEVQSIQNFNDYFLNINSPLDILVLNFEDLFGENRTSVINKICKFLEIPFNEIYLKPTRDGIVINSDEANIDSKPNDGAFLLTKHEKKIIIIHKIIYKLFKMPVNILSIKATIRFIYLKFRKII